MVKVLEVLIVISLLCLAVMVWEIERGIKENERIHHCKVYERR